MITVGATPPDDCAALIRLKPALKIGVTFSRIIFVGDNFSTAALSIVVMIGVVSGGVAPTVITATVRIIREVSATAVKALPVRH